MFKPLFFLVFWVKALDTETSVSAPAPYKNPTVKKVCFGPSKPHPGKNARDKDGTGTGRDVPHLRTRRSEAVNKAQGWDLDGPTIGPRQRFEWHPWRQIRLLDLSDILHEGGNKLFRAFYLQLELICLVELLCLQSVMSLMPQSRSLQLCYHVKWHRL